MIVTDKFIFIHLFRTGGSSIISGLDGKMIGYHRPRSLIPDEYLHLPVAGNVRNPFDWYVSVYYHCLNQRYPMRTPTFLNFLIQPDNFSCQKFNFNESIRRLLDTSWMTSNDKERFLSRLQPSYDWKTTLTDNLRREEGESYLKSGVGFLSWLFNYMYQFNGSTDGVTYTRLEDLKNHPKLNAMSGFNLNIGKIKEPRNADYMSYYEDDLIDLILHKDNDYIRRFKYD